MTRSDMTVAQPRRLWLRRAFLSICLSVGTIGAMSGCQDGIRQFSEAVRVAADLRIQFNLAANASIRAVMATTTEASSGFAREAEQARQTIKTDAEALHHLLRELKYTKEAELLAEFSRHFAEYEAIDRNILELAVQNTNLKAQKLSYGPAQEAADAFRAALETAAGTASPKSRCQVDSLVARATLAVREIQVLHAPHIAESSDAAMDSMEKQMSARLSAATGALDELSGLLQPAARSPLAVAKEALDRFKSVHDQIVMLSRRNSNVRSLELALGRARSVTTACDAGIRDLQAALVNEGARTTR